MRHAKTKEMLTYWMGLLDGISAKGSRNGALLWPERSDVVPQACPQLLADMFVLERAGHTNSYRLAGTHLCNLFGSELKNTAFSNLYQGSERRTVNNWVDHIGADQHLVLISSTGMSAGGDTLALETLLMPLRLNGEVGRRTLGITTASGTNHWLEHRPVQRLVLESVRMLQPWADGDHSIAGLGDVPWDTTNHAELQGEAPATLAFPTDRRRDMRQIDNVPPLANEAVGEVESVPYRRVGKLLVIEGGRSD